MCVCVCVCVCVWGGGGGCNRPQTGHESVILHIQTGDVLKTGTVPTLRVSANGCKSNVDYVNKWRKFVCTRNVPGYQWTVILIHKASPILHVVHHSVPSPIACSRLYTLCVIPGGALTVEKGRVCGPISETTPFRPGTLLMNRRA